MALAATFLSGCAIGPLVSHETARTVGDNKSELVGGYGAAGLVFKWNYGLSENLDFGLHWESLSVGIRAKYAFLNQSAGWSLAAALGTGSSIGGSHYYGDLMVSNVAGAWEPYGTLRIVHVNTDPVEFRDKDTGNVNFTVTTDDFEYGQLIFGTRYWFNEHWLISLEASSLFAISDNFKIESGAIVSGAFGYRF